MTEIGEAQSRRREKTARAGRPDQRRECDACTAGTFAASRDEVVLIERQGEATHSAEQVAERLGTTNDEVVSELLARVPRVDENGNYPL